MACILLCGKLLMVLSLLVGTSIILMETLGTMLWRIYKGCLRQSTYVTMGRRISDLVRSSFLRILKRRSSPHTIGTQQKRENPSILSMGKILCRNAPQTILFGVKNLYGKLKSLPRHGIPPPKGGFGIRDMPEQPTRSGNGLSSSAKNVLRNIARLSPLAPNIVMETAGTTPSVGEGESGWVYDLTVGKAGCYLANGILVSNCDALRYLCLSVQDPHINLNLPQQKRPEYLLAPWERSKKEGWVVNPVFG